MTSTAEQLIEEFLTEYRSSGVYLRDRIARLAELMTAAEAISQSASSAFFTKLVEPLADSFQPSAVSLYNRALAQIIQVCRRDPRAADLDRELTDFGLTSEVDLFARAERLRRSYQSINVADSALSIKRIIILSRVTIGADIAVTSVVIDRMKREFPRAEIVLVGGAKVSELFRGDSRVHFKEINYKRSGTTIERLSAWTELLGGMRMLTAGLNRTEYLIVDPDSRLTQLGLFPIEPTVAKPAENRTDDDGAEPEADNYLFFPSREYGSDTSCSLGELTSRWLDEIFADSFTTYPRISLCETDINAGRNLVARIRQASKPVIAINLGVGGNAQKRANDDFEAELVTQLIRQGVCIILDKGSGEDESRRADAIVVRATQIELKGRRIRAIDFDEHRLNSGHLGDEQSEILIWNGRVGVLAALIGESDLYIGYDSAGQHIAAALGVRCIDVFAGFGSQRFVDRWRPDGRAETRIITVGTTRTADLVQQVLTLFNELL